MNQGPRYVCLMEKSRGQKSRATVPLTSAFQSLVEFFSPVPGGGGGGSVFKGSVGRKKDKVEI